MPRPSGPSTNCHSVERHRDEQGAGLESDLSTALGESDVVALAFSRPPHPRQRKPEDDSD